MRSDFRRAIRTIFTCLVRVSTVGSVASHAMMTRVTFLAISFISLHCRRQNMRAVCGLEVSGDICYHDYVYISLDELRPAMAAETFRREIKKRMK